MEFLKHNWKDLKADITSIFSDFSRNGIINKVMDETYIALIAKQKKCDLASDYKPISLTTTMYKLLAKTLPDKLKITLPHYTISNYQMAFVKDRQITDAILIANETINFWRLKKVRGLVIRCGKSFR